MKKLLFPLTFLFILFSCSKNDDPVSKVEKVDLNISKLKALGFDLSEGFYKVNNGYIVENDIFFSTEDIDFHSNQKDNQLKFPIDLNRISSVKASNGDPKIIKKTSHYKTTNLVSFSSYNTFTATISIYLDPSLQNILGNELDLAINRYNNLNLALIFVRKYQESGSSIKITPTYIAPSSTQTAYLMAAGFPKNGIPYNNILVNTYYYNSNYYMDDKISTLAHEIGHCIGLRHTDYMDRNFSCSYKPNHSESSNPDGAIHIPGRPTLPESNSFMLACTNGVDRPFTQNDILALKTIYPLNPPKFYVRLAKIVDDRSTFSSCCDNIDIDITYIATFFLDKDGTIPYYATEPFVLRSSQFHNNTVSQVLNVTIPVGTHSYNFGTLNSTAINEWGTSISENNNYITVYPDYNLYLM